MQNSNLITCVKSVFLFLPFRPEVSKKVVIKSKIVTNRSTKNTKLDANSKSGKITKSSSKKLSAKNFKKVKR
jgi:hypothetical protein